MTKSVPTSAATPEQNRPLLGIALAIVAMFFFTNQDAVTKVLIQDLPISTVVLVRYTAFTLFAFALAAFTGPHASRGVLKSLQSPVRLMHVLRGLLLVYEIFIFSFGMRHIDLGLQHALFSVFPLSITALAWPLLGERVGPWRWGSVLVGFIGALVIIRPGLTAFNFYTIFPILAALMYALYNITTRRTGRSGDSFQTSMVYLGLVGWLAVLPFGLWQWVTPQGSQIGLLAILSATSIIGHGCMILALIFTQASVLQPLNYLLLVFAFCTGFLYFGEIPDLFTVLGGAIIVASGLFIILRERIRARDKALG